MQGLPLVARDTATMPTGLSLRLHKSLNNTEFRKDIGGYTLITIRENKNGK